MLLRSNISSSELRIAIGAKSHEAAATAPTSTLDQIIQVGEAEEFLNNKLMGKKVTVNELMQYMSKWYHWTLGHTSINNMQKVYHSLHPNTIALAKKYILDKNDINLFSLHQLHQPTVCNICNQLIS